MVLFLVHKLIAVTASHMCIVCVAEWIHLIVMTNDIVSDDEALKAQKSYIRRLMSSRESRGLWVH